MSLQTDDVLATYPEFQKGREDYDNGVYDPKQYPLIGSGGRFEKKAYMNGYFHRKREVES